MPDQVIAERESSRDSKLMWAYLAHHMKNVPKQQRDACAWCALLEWAAAGGKTSEVRKQFGGTA